MARIEVLRESECIGIVDAQQILLNRGPTPPADPVTGAPTLLRSFVVSQDPRILLVPGFLSEAECLHFRELAEGHWTRSLVGTVTQESEGKAVGKSGPSANGVYTKEAQTRTSSSCMLRPAQTAVVERVEHRLAALARLPLVHLERPVVVRYAPGEQFSKHHDGKFRPRTVFIYLNDLPEGDGGDTFFPHLGLSFVPRAGCAVMWSNALPDGREDSRMLHAGRPPATAVKYGVNCFFNDEKMRLVDNAAAEFTLEEAFFVDVPALRKGSQAPDRLGGGQVHKFSFNTAPPIVAVPGFASQEEVDHLLDLLGTGPFAGSCLLRVFQPAETTIVACLEERAALVARFPAEHVGALRIVRCCAERGLCNRGCGQRAAIVCLSERDDVFFPHLGLRYVLHRGDLLLWPNAVRSARVNVASSGGVGEAEDQDEGEGRSKGQDEDEGEEPTKGYTRRHVVEDLRALRVHLPVQGGPTISLDVSFHDTPLRPCNARQPH